MPVDCSLQDVDSITTHNVFRLLVRKTGWALADGGVETWIPGLPMPDSGKPFKLAFRTTLGHAFSDGDPFETFEFYLSTATDAADPLRVLLMLDKFDKLQEGIEDGITSPQVPENIRHLLQHQPGLCDYRRLRRQTSEEYWSALFGFGYRTGVSSLPREEAGRLSPSRLRANSSMIRRHATTWWISARATRFSSNRFAAASSTKQQPEANERSTSRWWNGPPPRWCRTTSNCKRCGGTPAANCRRLILAFCASQRE